MRLDAAPRHSFYPRLRVRVVPLAALLALLALVQLRLVAGLDAEILRWLNLHRPSGLADAFNWTFRLGFAQVDAAIALGWFALLVARRRSLAGSWPPLLLFLVIGVEVGLRLVVRQPPPDGSYSLLRTVADQPVSSVLDQADAVSRQTFVRSVVGSGQPTDERGSFPSGHAARSLFLALVAAYELRRRASRRASPLPRFRVKTHPLAIAAFALAAVIGSSAVFFGYHWPSDVLGGYLLALVVWWGAATLGWIPNATIDLEARR